MVKIGDRSVETTIINGVQRLPENRILSAWVTGTTEVQDAYNSSHMDYSKRDVEFFNLNNMYEKYIKGDFTFDEWLDFMLNIGYSVSGFADLHDFSHLEIVNPVWEYR